ncbi:glycerate 2-kinase [Burkholderiales bacterium]|nr:glycerate 2-kinase [Burkholderiales bacterium]
MTPAPLRVVVAPDSFKGSLTAPGAAAAIAEGVARGAPTAVTIARPMADGGEGTLDTVLRASGADSTRGALEVEGAGGAPLSARYGIVEHGGAPTAVLEAAQVVAITDAAGMSVPVTSRTTTGLGRQMRALMDRGVRRFMVGLGGTSTNDGGAGFLVALGLRLVDERGHDVAPTPDGLSQLARADASPLDARLAGCEITIMSDVNNPLTGPRGATAIFGPQKGVAKDRVEAIDATIARFAAIVEESIGRRASARPGAGAAGGLGYALMLAGATMRTGADVVADLIGLDAALGEADWAITGEGRSDTQTLLAKAPSVVADRARARRVPVTLVSGAIDPASLHALHAKFDGCFALPAGPATLDECVRDAASLLADRAEAIARVFDAARSRQSAG